MDGILFLVLIFWAFARMNKKAKKQIASSSKLGKTTTQQKKQTKEHRFGTEKRIAAMPAKEPAEGEGFSRPMLFAEETFRGSMQTDSMEGECICDPELEHEREPAPESVAGSVYANEIGKEPLVDFSPRGLMQGFVMSEILTRPAQRTNRR